MGLRERLSSSRIFKENRLPKRIESCSFERVLGDVRVSFNTGLNATIRLIKPSPDYPTITEPIIIISLSAGRYPRFTDLGEIDLRGKGVVKLTDGKQERDINGRRQKTAPVPGYFKTNPTVFINQLADLLDDVDPQRVWIDSNWGWNEDRADKIKTYIKEYTDPMRQWVEYYNQAEKSHKY